MKKSLILVGLLSIGYAHAQEGRVGINTETPTATLNVKSLGNTDKTKNLELVNANNKPLVTVLDNANMGINNTQPVYLLDIKGTDGSYARNSIALRGARPGDGSIGFDIYKARGTNENPEILQLNDISGHIGFSPYNGVKYMAAASISGRVTGNIVNDKAVPISLDFRTVKNFKDPNVSYENVAMRIYHDGNIGMGTIEPTNKLHIKPELGKDPLKVEGLQLSDLGTEDILVAGTDGVVKKVKRTSLNGNENTSESEWIYDEASKQIKLKRSGQGTFTNQIFYNGNNGVFYDVDGGLSTTTEELETIIKDGITTPNITHTPLSDIQAGQVYFRESQSIPTGIFTKKDGDKVYSKTFVSEGYRLDAKDNFNYNNIFGKRTGISIESNNSNDYSNATVYGSYNSVFANGTRSVKNVSGSYNSITVNGEQSVDDAITAATYFTRIQTTGKVKRAVGLTGATRVSSNTTQDIDDMRGGNFYIDIDPNTPALIKSMTGMIAAANTSSTNVGTGSQLRGALIQAVNKGATKYPKQVTLELAGLASTTSLPTYHYGLKINNIEGAELGAYAIHTGKGKVHLGDKVEVKSSIKVASPQTAEKCTSDNAGTMSYKEINGSGVFGFCTKKESGEYVWAYLKGAQLFGESTNGGAFGSGL